MGAPPSRPATSRPPAPGGAAPRVRGASPRAALRLSLPLIPPFAQTGGGGYQGGRTGGGFGNKFPPPPPPLDKAALKAKPPKLPPPPAGSSWYETMLALRPDATAAERSEEVSSVVGLLERGGASELFVSAREAQPTAYPMNGHRSAYYAQISFAAPPQTVQAMHAKFAVPVAGREPVRIRHLTLKLK